MANLHLKRIKDWATSITSFRTGDVIPVDGPSGTAKMSKDDLLKVTAQNALAGNVAEEFVPNETNAVAGKPYVYGGALYMCKENTNGDWDANKFEMVGIDAIFAQSVLPNNFLSRNLLNVLRVYGVEPVELSGTIVRNKLLRRDGTLRDEAGFTVSYYNVESVKAVLISGRQGAYSDYAAIACFYNSAETFNSTTAMSPVVLDQGTSYSNYALEVPAGAKMVAVTGANQFSISGLCFGLSLEDILMDISEQSISADKLLKSNGTVSTLAGFTTNYYNVEGVETIAISGRQGAYSDYTAIACFYNSTKTFDSTTAMSPVVLDQLTSYSNYALEVPAGAKVIAVCGNVTAPSSCKRAVVKSVTTDILKNVNDVDRINYELFSNFTQVQPQSVSADYLLKSNGTLKSWSGFNVNYYNVEGVETIAISGRQGAYSDYTAIACFYNSTKTFNSTTLVSPVILEQRTTYKDYVIKVPSGAKVIAVCGSLVQHHIDGSCAIVDLSGDVLKTILDELSGIENNKELPDYWMSYIDSRTQDILSYLDTLDPSKYDSFIFVTDLHYPEYSFGRTFNITSYLLEHLPTNKIFVGGDIIQTNTNFNTKYKELTDKIKDKYRVFAIRGNHDVSNKQYFYPHFLAKLDDTLACDGVQSELYYFVDNKSKKIRYIFCDSNNPDSGSIGQAQLDWISSKITELAVGWSVILITHGLWIAANKDTTITRHTVDYTRLTGLLDSLYDTVDASIIGIISGHCHRDWSETAQKGYILIGTTCDANGYMSNTFDPVAPTRTEGTITENAMDYFIIDVQNKAIKAFRIGAGNDRLFNFA